MTSSPLEERKAFIFSVLRFAVIFTRVPSPFFSPLTFAPRTCNRLQSLLSNTSRAFDRSQSSLLPPELTATSRGCCRFQTLLLLSELAAASGICYRLQTLTTSSRPCYRLQTLLPPPDLATQLDSTQLNHARLDGTTRRIVGRSLISDRRLAVGRSLDIEQELDGGQEVDGRQERLVITCTLNLMITIIFVIILLLLEFL